MLKTTPKYLVKTNKHIYPKADLKSAMITYNALKTLGFEPEIIGNKEPLVTVRIY